MSSAVAWVGERGVFVGISAVASGAESKGRQKNILSEKILFPALNISRIIEPNKRKFH
jgi:hypothetical protein